MCTLTRISVSLLLNILTNYCHSIAFNGVKAIHTRHWLVQYHSDPVTMQASSPAKLGKV